MLTCELVQQSLSALADGEAPDAPVEDVDAHVAGCDECRAFDEHLHAIRSLLRFEPVGDVPDLAPAVLARLPEQQRRPIPWRAAAAAAVVGAVAGASFVGIGRDPTTVAAADLPERVVEVQPAVTTLAADVVVETSDARWTGTLRYESPESLAVLLHDRDGDLLATVADGGTWWKAGPVRCIPPGPAPCAPDTLQAIEGRAPFADNAPMPLELVAPVDSLSRAAEPEQIGTRDGAIGVRVTAGQIAGLLDGIDPTHALRPVHPSDPVDLWLDDEYLVPVEVIVRAGDSPERLRWAAAQGLRDRPGDEVLAIRLDDLEVDGDLPANAFPDPPADADVRDGGFEPDPSPDVVPEPAELPTGFVPGRSGTVDGVGIRTWSDGRAWVAIRAASPRSGTQLFGDLGDYVVPVDLGAAGVGYSSADGTRIGLFSTDVDVVVLGSVGPDVLHDIAASLGIVGMPVNKGWAASTADALAQATRLAPDLLVAGELDGFDGPALRIDGEEVTLRYTGPGARRFLLVRSADPELAPPLDAEVVAVPVRGTTGRWSASSGDLEWVEDGHARALRSPTLSLPELLAIADELHPA